MALVRSQVILPYLSGLPEDVATNTWWFSHPTDDMATMEPAITAALEDFYQVIDLYLAHYIDDGACIVRHYDWADPEPRVPITSGLALSIATTQDALPGEVSTVLSFRAALPSTPRRRGRVFLGPLRTTVLSQSVSNPVRVNPTYITAVGNAVAALQTGLDAAGITHMVYSKTAAQATGVALYWMNNEFDTQRRRGVVESSRTAWAA